MDSRKVERSRWTFWLGLAVLEAVWGLPGRLDDSATWRDWLGNMSGTWLSGAAAGVGALLIGTWAVVNSVNYLRGIQKLPPLREVIVFVLVSAGIIWGAVVLRGIIYRPDLVWTHPLTLNELQKARAECEMRAYEAIGEGGSLRSYPLEVSDRVRYINACMTSKGFVMKERSPEP